MNRTRFAPALAMAALAAILLPSFLHAQITFQRTYGGADYDECSSVQQTKDGGYIMAGLTLSFTASGCDVWLVKTDAYGNKLWDRTFDKDTIDKGYSVQQTSDSGYIIAGWAGALFGGDRSDAWLIKTDSDGSRMWDKTYGSTGDEYALSVRQVQDGGYVLAGYTDSYGSGSFDVWLIKTDANGDAAWSRTYGGPDSDGGASVQLTADSGYVIAGFTQSYGAGDRDVYLIKTDSDGDTSWTRAFGGAGLDEGHAVQQTTDGGYVVTGYSYSNGHGFVYLVRTDSGGDTLWTREYRGLDDEGTAVIQTGDGGFVVAGWAFPDSAQSDICLIKVSSSGDTMWTRMFGGSDYEEGWSVEQTTDGGFVIAGSTMSYGAGYWDFYLIKTDSLGNVAVAEPKTSPKRAPGLSLTCEPNPCRGRTAVSLQLTANSPGRLTLFDATGRLVRTMLVHTSPFPLSFSGLAAGTYFLRLDAGDEHATTRVVLQR